MERSKTEAATSKVESAVALGGLGASIGGPLGGALGAGIGLYIGDGETVFPLDMVAIPAYQAYMINGSPSLQLYIRAGETLMPTGGNVEDVQQVVEAMAPQDTPKRKKPKTAHQRAYGKAFKRIASKYKLKNGQWKKDGFKRAVKEAHKIAGGKK